MPVALSCLIRSLQAGSKGVSSTSTRSSGALVGLVGQELEQQGLVGQQVQGAMLGHGSQC